MASTLPITNAALEQRDHAAQQVHRVGPRGRVGVGEVLADVAEAAAPSSASMTAWVSTSASEWPASPSSCGISDAAEDERPPGGERVRVDPEAGADHQPAAPSPPPAPSNTQSSVTPRVERGDRVLVAVADLLGQVRVAGEGDRQARVHGHVEQRGAG